MFCFLRRIKYGKATEYLVGEIDADDKVQKLWVRATNEIEAIKVYRMLTNSTGDCMIIRKR